jgi:carbonic anhydrase
MKNLAVAVILVLAVTSWTHMAQAKNMNRAANESLKLLQDGNARFAGGKTVHPHQDLARMKEVAPQQKPFATIVSCSDSRVPPEILFDQGVGDIFVVRSAGNVLDEIGIGSVEYAAEHLGVPLVVVMGHKSCGAVKAAFAGGEKPHGHIGALVEAIAPAVAKTKAECKDGGTVDDAVRANTEMIVKSLRDRSDTVSHLIEKGKLAVVGAYYDIETGKVEF